MQSTVFDYAIIGGGAAGLQLCLAMLDDPYFEEKQILLLEKAAKTENDKTWCFWEKGNGRFDEILTQSWNKAAFITPGESKSFELHPYRYKMLRSADFYHFAKTRISKAENIVWVKEEVRKTEKHALVKIIGEQNQYQAKHVFDSRIHPDFHKADDSYTRILQHFKGWTIETEEEVFNPDEFVMMDFRLKWKDSASFTYILPVNSRKALIEFTLFTPQLIKDEDYDLMLNQYIQEVLKPGKFTIREVEQGVIPMSDYPFHKENDAQITKIGTAGSWVKPSSGYSFKNAGKYSQKIIENLKAGNMPSKDLFNKRFQFYDPIFLDVLNNRNELGESIFTDMYHKNPVQQIFKFLDEETTITEEIQIMNSFQKAPFLKSLWNYIWR